MNGVFITGTDTGVGKTLVCGLLAGALRRRGCQVVTQKWVQTGATHPEDLATHHALSGIADDDAARALENPYLFTLPASPHLAAEQEGQEIDPEVIARAYRALAARADLVLVEGAGGALVPLTRRCLTLDVAAQLRLPAVLVVANKLGCVNHALLTIEALRYRRIPLLGTIFNRPEEGGEPLVLADNPRVVTEMSGAPLLGALPPLADAADGRQHIDPIADAFVREWRKFADARLA